MTWDDVRFFLAVAQARSLTGAGRDLRTSTQTVGRRIAVLERSLGSTLFLRGAGGYRLTDDGAALLPDATAIKESVARFRARAYGRSSGLTGKMRVAAPESLTTHVILPKMSAFLRDHPGLDIEFSTGVEVVSMAGGAADIAIRLARPDRGDLTIRRIGTMANALYASPFYLDAKDNLRDSPFSGRLIGWDASYDRLPAARWLTAEAGRTPDYRFTSILAQRAAAVASLGVAFLPCYLGDGLEALHTPTPLEEGVWIVTHSAAADTDRVGAVHDELVRIIKEARTSLMNSKDPP